MISLFYADKKYRASAQKRLYPLFRCILNVEREERDDLIAINEKKRPE